MARWLEAADPDFESAFAALTDTHPKEQASLAGRVREIVEAVRLQGFAAVADFTRRFDGIEVDASSVRLSADEIREGARACPQAVRDALAIAAARIRAYHQRQAPADEMYTDEDGVRLGWRWTPVDAAGLYAPGGRAAYPSSVLMNALPAKVAGVGRLAMATPAPSGAIPPAVLAAAEIAGVNEIYRVGGAQAIAAFAFGAAPIPRVDVIVGPGNAYVAEAKRQVFGHVGVDSVAGPSEILVVADGAADPEWIAADLLSQAEHDPSSRSLLITDDRGFAAAVIEAAARQLAASTRRDIAAAAWTGNSAIIIVRHLDDAPALVNRLAPEHLELAVADPDALLAKVRHAGAIFLGRHTPEAIGDYVAGPNHVLPTAGGARFASGLSVLDFMKRSSIMGCEAGSLARIGPVAAALADAEGLPSHAQSVRIRLK